MPPIFTIVEGGSKLLLYRPLHDAMRRHRTLLVVDEDCARLSARKVALETYGYGVICARNAQEALKHVSTPAIEMVVADERLKVNEGQRLFDAVKKLRPELLTVPMNAPAEPDDADSAGKRKKRRPSDGLLSPAQLLEAIRLTFYRRRGPGAVALARARHAHTSHL